MAQQPTGTAAFSGIESTGDWSCGSLTAEEGSVTSKGNEEKKFNRSVDVAETSENGEQTMGAGLYVKSEVTLHVSSGLQVKVGMSVSVLSGGWHDGAMTPRSMYYVLPGTNILSC